MAKGDKFGGGSGWGGQNNYTDAYLQQSMSNPINYNYSYGLVDPGMAKANSAIAGAWQQQDMRRNIEWANQQKMSDPAYWAQAFGMGGGAAPTNQYETRLNSLMDNPDSIAKSGVYKFAFDQGNEAVNRNMAAKGLLKSGNRLGELTKFGQGLASQQYGNEANRLASLASSRYAVDAQGQNQVRAMAMEAAMKNAAPRTYQTPGGTLTRWN